MQRIEALEEYNRAQRLGVRDYREKTAAGKYPYLPALDELLEKTDTESQIPLGTIENTVGLCGRHQNHRPHPGVCFQLYAAAARKH